MTGSSSEFYEKRMVARAQTAVNFSERKSWECASLTLFQLSRTQIKRACAAWKDRVNIEDMLFAGAVLHHVKHQFSVSCDSSQIAETVYLDAQSDLFAFMQAKNASHYQRLMGYGLEKDIRYCLTPDVAPVLPVYENGKLIVL